ncbi:hypothetical protein [Minwuia thermotolerans]|uniref:hypothetical protein n=1 Tax=Minwuia thermotolerans TaxID=2056226 RepID=UPI000F63B446|nr:hypothetical protein [Minwuia thermotolerans]
MAEKDMSFLGLNRPQYVPSPELFVSELAWSLVDDTARQALASGDAKNGLAYTSRGAKPQKAGILFTRPEKGSGPHDRLGDALDVKLNLGPSASRHAAEVLLDELEAISSNRATRATVVPLTGLLSLLQDRRGISGQRNPPNIALILEQLFALGGTEGTAAGAWLRGVSPAHGAGIPGWLDEVLGEIVPPEVRPALEELGALGTSALAGKTLEVRRPAWIERSGNTPFHWFHSAWTNLCQSGWVAAMPRRRWTDWASCITRTALASGFLFEMHLNRRLVAALASEESADAVVDAMMDQSGWLFTWDDRLSKSSGDVGPVINELSASGTACQALLDDLARTHEGIPEPRAFDEDPNGLVAWLERARDATRGSRAQVERDLAAALEASPPSSAKNVRETIRYSLLARGNATSLDLYALLKTAGRYTCVDPGQEWLVTVSSLCSREPGIPSRLADLYRALGQVGIKASASSIVPRLETYGLARGSHDADQAIELEPAF